MKAVVDSWVQVTTNLGKIFELDEDETKAVEEVKSGKKDKVVLDKGFKFVVVEGKNGIITVSDYYRTVTSIVLDESYILESYRDLLVFLKANQPCRKKDLEKVFGFKVDKFVRDAKALGLIKSSNKGYSLTEKGEELIQKLAAEVQG